MRSRARRRAEVDAVRDFRERVRPVNHEIREVVVRVAAGAVVCAVSTCGASGLPRGEIRAPRRPPLNAPIGQFRQTGRRLSQTGATTQRLSVSDLAQSCPAAQLPQEPPQPLSPHLRPEQSGLQGLPTQRCLGYEHVSDFPQVPHEKFGHPESPQKAPSHRGVQPGTRVTFNEKGPTVLTAYESAPTATFRGGSEPSAAPVQIDTRTHSGRYIPASSDTSRTSRRRQEESRRQSTTP